MQMNYNKLLGTKNRKYFFSCDLNFHILYASIFSGEFRANWIFYKLQFEFILDVK